MININIDWQRILDSLRTENLIDFFTSKDPMELARDPWVIVPSVLLVIVLYCTKFKKVAAILIGLCCLWLGLYYGMPEEGAGIEMKSVVSLGGSFIAVAAYWIYVFLIQND